MRHGTLGPMHQPPDRPSVPCRHTVHVEIFMKGPLPLDTLPAFAGDEFRARIFYDKYAARDEQNRQRETLPSQMWDRIAREIASVEPDEARRAEWTQRSAGCWKTTG